MRRLRGAIAALLLILPACKASPSETVRPALWEVTGPQGQKGWLFGTIHALPQAVSWRTPAVDAALTGSDGLVLEIADAEAVPAVFARLSQTPGQPPLADRVPPSLHARLAQVMREHQLSDAQFANVESWAAALLISQAAQGDATADNGLEEVLRKAFQGKSVGELEGGATQLGVFDALPEQDQRDLLAGVIEEASRPLQDKDPLYDTWAAGDLKGLEHEARTGLLADPQLHEALLAGRNRAWAPKIAAMLRAGRHPLVAVGAAHMVSADGLPALMTAQGYTVKRVQ